MSKRTIRVVSTKMNGVKTISSGATTREQLEVDLKAAGIEFKDMLMLEDQRNSELLLPESVLPEGEFNLHLLTKKVSSALVKKTKPTAKAKAKPTTKKKAPAKPVVKAKPAVKKPVVKKEKPKTKPTPKVKSKETESEQPSNLDLITKHNRLQEKVKQLKK